MSTPKERAKVANAIWKKLVPLCSNGDKEAALYLKQIFYVVRMIDDLYDGDYEVSKQELIRGFFVLMADMPHNKFYQKNLSALSALHTVGFNAWQDANTWSGSKSGLKKVYAHVLRDLICEIFILVAFLTGGETNMKKASKEVRVVFLKKIKAD